MLQFRQPFRGDYQISLDFGETFPPLYTPESPHEGIDYLTPMGTEILASADGYVQMVGNLDVGYGKFVKLAHEQGKVCTIYAHLSEAKVKALQPVKQGDIIGLSGNSGNSTGPHLHFEMRKNGVKVDPKTVLISKVDYDAPVYTPAPTNIEFEPVSVGFCEIVCDLPVNVRCHCDPNRIIKRLKKGTILYIGEEKTYFWSGYPYRYYYDSEEGCKLLIAEHDSETQILRNVKG